MSTRLFESVTVELIRFAGPMGRPGYQLTSAAGAFVTFDAIDAKEIARALIRDGEHAPCPACDGEYCQRCGRHDCPKIPEGK